ncbi:hypothetical protein PIN31009_03890 [Pandoraea iniqua]|uniref:Uncharacterized protein n=1 Tax=Pandoraea iniqua TaxID=2508288 RepID=A0A5E4Y0S8_9BURK|nr:hypothetical protein [Pandoraea iniqua]VVE36385.1 hypothetical protein PIN31009_03890 [Pandoraea iniqua]VVE42244.1 hypothetical protein PIN31115_04192 [Pandoraea iniqua]
MSYDLMVFEPTAAPKDRQQFMTWFQGQTAWSEAHSYDDPVVSSPALQAWFLEMVQHFPAMNGPYASDDVDDPKVTDYCVGQVVIYSAFAWSCAEEAYGAMKRLADKHSVGFFDVSADQGEIIFPDN